MIQQLTGQDNCRGIVVVLSKILWDFGDVYASSPYLWESAGKQPEYPPLRMPWLPCHHPSCRFRGIPMVQVPLWQNDA